MNQDLQEVSRQSTLPCPAFSTTVCAYPTQNYTPHSATGQSKGKKGGFITKPAVILMKIWFTDCERCDALNRWAFV